MPSPHATLNHVPPRIHLLGLAATTMILTIMVAQPVLPLYLQARGLPTVEMGVLVGIMSLSIIGTELAALAVSRRIGRRGTILLGSLGGAATQLWFAMAATRLEWYLSRLLFGAFRGLLWPVLFAEVADSAPPGRHGPAFATFWLYFGVGLLAGPWMGGWLADAAGLRAPLVLSAAVALLPVALGGAVSPQRDAALPLGTSLRALARRGEVLSVWTLNALHTTGYGLFSTFLPLHATAQGLDASQVGLLFAAGSAAFAAAQLPAGRALERRTALGPLAAVYLARAAVMAAVPLAHSFAALLVLNGLVGIVGAAVPAALSARLAAVTPRGEAVPAMGALNAAADLGFFLGPVLGGTVAVRGLSWPFLLTLPIAAAAAALLRATASRAIRTSAAGAPARRLP
ncbi:MAG: MFS transporter [Armatimonadota bacterium]|nr:MFS transporter [Armatimonadota bacterium]MDR7427291.1 MFS transporter [Armatimonadota bacterium]MDR7464847.1 MFS transporter [Armatimonadota bacterium]MDR7469913.1 MFS transporter [Armatimonadota bacterium]MDR7474598.1 MFS transporter [Armatimonadota bacterium]